MALETHGWVALPFTDLPHFDPESVRAHWARLHAGQIGPPPASDALARAWASYHNGDFARAVTEAQALGDQPLPPLPVAAMSASAVSALALTSP